MAAVKPDLRTQRTNDETDELVADVAPLFDELYARVDAGRPLDAPFVQKLNETNERLVQRWEEVVKERLAAVRAGVERGER